MYVVGRRYSRNEDCGIVEAVEFDSEDSVEEAFSLGVSWDGILGLGLHMVLCCCRRGWLRAGMLSLFNNSNPDENQPRGNLLGF